MATIRVTSTSALTAALKSAVNGDTITLASGHYNLSTSGLSKALTITTTEGAVFDSMDLSRTSNLVIDNVDFNGKDGVKNAFRVWGSDNITIRNGDMEGVASGTGLGRGIFVQNSTDFKLASMTIHGFQVGAYLDNVTDFTLSNNTLTNIGLDGIVGGQLHEARILDNSISIKLPAGVKHSDGIQLWNVKGQVASTDITIEGNYIQTNNLQSHGIYANIDAGGKFYENVTVAGNTIVSGDGLGLSWGQVNHLDIHGNIILRDMSLPADKAVPSIRVNTVATDVSVTGNVTHKAPTASDSAWQAVSHSSADWTIANNPIIRVGATLAEAQALLASLGGSPATPATPATPELPAGDGGDTFRFDAVGKTDFVRGLDFDHGDRVVLHHYQAGTFPGGDGRQAVIGSLDDLHALDAASKAVHVREGAHDTIVIDIAQAGPDHAIKLVGLAHDYF